LWKTTEESEKKKVLQEFISEHGEHYTHDELLNYLEKKYRSRLSPYTLPISSKEQEH
jgi:deoxyribodipyrimidine photolyase